jgi:2-dehydro-3-deoxyphosphooctonate aldolase (KDO 8-P synthase)
MKLCGFDVGLEHPFFLIAGTCSIEGLELSLEVAGRLQEACAPLGIPLIYKGSFDKANRSSGTTARGLGLDKGLQILDEVRRQTGLPILTDVHDESQVAEVASVVDVLQTPAFLCRQTDFIRAVAKSGKRCCAGGGLVG